MANFGPLTVRSVPSLRHIAFFNQQVSRLGFVTAATSLTVGQPNFARSFAVSWAGIIYIARCKIHFTFKSCVLLHLQRNCRAHQQRASVKLCRMVQGMKLRNFCRGHHIYSAGRPSRWFMVALCNRADHLYFHHVSFFFLLFFISSPNLSGRRLDVYHTSTHGVASVRIWNAGLKCAALGSLKNTGRKKSPKIAISAPSHKFVGLYLPNKARIDNRKKIVKHQYVLHKLS